MSFLKDAFQYLTGLGSQLNKIETATIDGRTFTTQSLNEVQEARPAALTVNNLSGLVHYLKSNYDEQPPVLLQVASPTEVNVYSTYDRSMKRKHLLQASALLPNIPFGKYLDLENFNILLQSCFVANDHRAELLKIVGSVTEENIANFGDDGISQQVTAKSGIASHALVPVPNPVLLKPFRTFADIPQPESQFVFRMQKGPAAALFEADGGAWKLSAIHTIAHFLSDSLSKEIEAGRVTIIA